MLKSQTEIIAAAVAGALQGMQGHPKRRDMEVGAQATPVGCCDFFDRCGDGDLMSLYFGGRLPLLDYLGFNVSDVCYRSVEFITYVRPAYSAGVPTHGFLANPCEDPHGIEYGSCKITVEDFGRYGRLGPTREIMKPKKYCLTDPLWRLDGTPVTSELEWDQKFVMDTILGDINEAVIDGNIATPGQFDGLERWVRTGYDCSILDSTVIDFQGNPMSGGAGITWNGVVQAAGYSFVDYLQAVYRRERQRISWAKRLATEVMSVGDIIILMPHSMIPCLLDAYTCWSVCPTDVEGGLGVGVFSYEARTFRQQLMGGMFGDGKIYLEGFEIPILGYDFGLINGPTTGDIYMLTGSVGNYRVWFGDHIDANVAAREFGGAGYFSTDGGRVLWKVDLDNECRVLKGWIHPRLFCKAPWLQTRFEDVQCLTPGGFLSGDPNDTSFFPETSFSQANCP